MSTALRERIGSLIEHAVAGRPVAVSVSLVTEAGSQLAIDEHRPHYAASTMKLPVLIAAYREKEAGRLDLGRQLMIRNDFASQVGGRFAIEQSEDSDDQPWDRLGQSADLGWLCRRMIVRSSNLTTNLVLDAVGLPAVRAAIEAADAPGLVVQRAIGDFRAQQAGRSNLISTAGLTTMLLALAAGRLADPSGTEEMLGILAANEMATDIRAGLPADTWVAHKNGWVDEAVHDAALVRPPAGEPFALAVATSITHGARSGLGSSADPQALWSNEVAHRLIREIASAVWADRR